MGLFKLQFRIGQVAQYAARYSYEDDSMQRGIGVAARQRGWYTRAEFVQVCRWKTPRSAPLVAQNSAAEVKAASRIALAQGTEDRERMRALRGLAGVDWATASAFTSPTQSSTQFGMCARFRRSASTGVSRPATPAGRNTSPATAIWWGVPASTGKRSTRACGSGPSSTAARLERRREDRSIQGL